MKNIPDLVLIGFLERVLNCDWTLREFDTQCQSYKVRNKIYSQNWDRIEKHFDQAERKRMEAFEGEYWEKLRSETGPIPKLDSLVEILVLSHQKKKLTEKLSTFDVQRIDDTLAEFIEERKAKRANQLAEEKLATQVFSSSTFESAIKKLSHNILNPMLP